MKTATTTKERAMSLSQIVSVPASTVGALDGFECKCSCGLVLRSSLRSCIERDAAEHIAYHAKRGAWR